MKGGKGLWTSSTTTTTDRSTTRPTLTTTTRKKPTSERTNDCRRDRSWEVERCGDFDASTTNAAVAVVWLVKLNSVRLARGVVVVVLTADASVFSWGCAEVGVDIPGLLFPSTEKIVIKSRPRNTIQ